jgi:hypothetical protein
MSSQQAMTPEQAVDRLIGMGYFKFLPESEWGVGRHELIASMSQGYLGTEWNKNCVSRENRTYPADSEELAEGRMGEFILLIREILSREGVQLHSIEDDFRDERYDVVIDGRIYPVHDTNILVTWSSWTIAAKRFLEIVNDLLRTTDSGERLYGIHGGNDGRAIFLTAEMYDLLQSSPLISDHREMPYRPSAINRDGTIKR